MSQATIIWREWGEEKIRRRLVCVCVWRAGEWPVVCVHLCVCLRPKYLKCKTEEWCISTPVSSKIWQETVDHDTDIFLRDVPKTQGSITVSSKFKWQRTAPSWSVNYSRTYVCSGIWVCNVKWLWYLKRDTNTIILIPVRSYLNIHSPKI